MLRFVIAILRERADPPTAPYRSVWIKSARWKSLAEIVRDVRANHRGCELREIVSLHPSRKQRADILRLTAEHLVTPQVAARYV